MRSASPTRGRRTAPDHVRCRGKHTRSGGWGRWLRSASWDGIREAGGGPRPATRGRTARVAGGPVRADQAWSNRERVVWVAVMAGLTMRFGLFGVRTLSVKLFRNARGSPHSAGGGDTNGR